MNLDPALATFSDEARDLLAQMEDLLLAAEAGEVGAEAQQALFRCAHTIKGSAGLFGLDAVVRFTHSVEGVLDRLRSGELVFSPALASLLLDGKDHIAALLAGDLPPDGSGLQQRLAGYLAPPAGRPESSPAAPALAEAAPATVGRWHLSLRFSPGILGNGMDPLSFIRYLSHYGEIVHVETRPDALPAWADYDAEKCYLGFEVDLDSAASREEIDSVFDFVRDDAEIRLVALSGGAEPKRGGEAGGKAGNEAGDEKRRGEERRSDDRRAPDSHSIKIPADRLDQLINLVGELLIAGASSQLLARRAGQPELVESAGSLLRLVEDIRDTALRLRMVPVGEVFGRFPRIVRDVARDLGKDIVLRISGAETEVDKALVERIGDPLLHMVRNAIDHGIEPAGMRSARGKPAQGTVELNAHHEAGCIVIEVADDGGGLDCQRILQKAGERGLVAPGQSLSRQEIFRLVFAPGFSTAAQVTSLSGRGVGMDVVKSAIEALRGSIEIDSEAGQGTRMRICLPLTLAIIDGFLVEAGAAQFILPLDAVVECIDLPPAAPGFLNLRGEVLPFVGLGELFGLAAVPSVRRSIVVVRCGGSKAGIVVDRLLGECQAVIKPLGRLFAGVPGLSGSTILASGAVALILDVPQLVAAAAERESLAAAAVPAA